MPYNMDMTNVRIASVEDDESISLIICKTLQKQGYDVFRYLDGESFLEDISKNKPNVVLLDLMLPGIQGKEVLDSIRRNKEYDDVHVIVVSAKSMISDKVELLDAGADDYLSKPFEIAELISRVGVQARRNDRFNRLEKGAYSLDLDRGSVYYKKKPIHVTSSEFLILKRLLEGSGKIVSREELLSCFTNNSDKSSKALDMHIRSLRSKLGSDSIVSIYGSGYKIIIS